VKGDRIEDQNTRERRLLLDHIFVHHSYLPRALRTPGAQIRTVRCSRLLII
jgi:hypothetical protein